MVTTRHVRNVIAARIQDDRAWLERPVNRSLKDEREHRVRQDLKDLSPSAWRNITENLQSLALWYATKGLVAWYNGERSGTNDIYRSYLYNTTSLRIAFDTFHKARGLGGLAYPATLDRFAGLCALCLANAMVLDDVHESSFLLANLKLMLADGRVVSRAYWNEHGVESFIYHIAALKNEAVDAAGSICQNIVCYQKIIAAWHNSDELGRCVLDACDFHCMQMEADGDCMDPCFSDPPYDLIPFEMLALYRCREAIGLETPAVSHVLLDGPLCVQRIKRAEIDDDILNQIAIEM